MATDAQKPERVAVYIDGANAYFAQKEALGWWIDWEAFARKMRAGKDLVSARWYQSFRAEPDQEQENFLNHLTLGGFAVRQKTLKRSFDLATGESIMKGTLDVELTVDVLTELELYDTAILVTGDADFVPLVEALRSRGKRVMVVATKQNVSVELRKSVGVNYIDFEELRSEIESDKSPAIRDGSDSIPMRSAAAEGSSSAPRRAVRTEEPRRRQSSVATMVQETEAEDVDLPEENAVIRCRVQAVKKYGVFLDLHQHAKTLLHVKDMNRGFVPDAGELYSVGEEIMVQVISIDRKVSPPEVRVAVVTPDVEY